MTAYDLTPTMVKALRYVVANQRDAAPCPNQVPGGWNTVAALMRRQLVFRDSDEGRVLPTGKAIVWVELSSREES